MNGSSHEDCGPIDDRPADQNSHAPDFYPEAISSSEFINSYAEASQALSAGRGPPGVKVLEVQPVDAPIRKPNLGKDDTSRTQVRGISTTLNLSIESTKGASAAPHLTGAGGPLMMTVSQVAALLSISVSNVWRLKRKEAGFPQPLKIGGSTRWHREDVERYLNNLRDRGQAGI